MRSKTSFFNRTLYLNTITRFWPLWAAYLAIWLLILPLPLQASLRYTNGANTIYTVQSFVLNTAIYDGVIMSIIFAALAAMATYHFMYNARSINAIASLPVRREGTFLCSFLAGLSCLLASNVLVFLVAVAVEAAFGVLQIAYLLQWLAIVSMLILFFYGFAVLCAQFTGHLLALPLLYFLLNFAVVVLEYIVRAILSSFVFGMNSMDIKLEALSPAVKLFDALGIEGNYTLLDSGETIVSSYYFTGWGVLGIYAGVGVVLAAIALLLYKHRHMETASDFIAVRPLRPVFKYCFTVGCGLVLGTLIFSIFLDNNAVSNPLIFVSVCIAIGAFIGYFAAQMLLNKTFRVFKKGWTGFAVTVVVLIAFLVAFDADLFGYERRVPDAERVSSVLIQSNGESMEVSDPEQIAAVIDIHSGIVGNKAQHEQYGQQYGRYVDSRYVRLAYELKDGGTIQREYNVICTDEQLADPGSDIMKIQAFYNTPAAIAERKATEIPVTAQNVISASVEYFNREEAVYYQVELTPEEAEELYNTCIVPDMEAGNIGRVWIVTTQDYYETAYAASIYIDLAEKQMNTAEGREPYSYVNDYFRTTPLVASQHTVAWLAERGIALCTEGEATAVDEYYAEYGAYPATRAVEYGD
jgi:ABC-2 type transport system permease protein